MIFQKLNENTLVLKAAGGSLSLTTDGVMTIDTFRVEGPGEYDVAGIGAHVHDGWAIITAETVHMLAVWVSGAKIVNDDDESIDVLIDLAADANALAELVKSLDPRVVIFSHTQTAAQVARHDGSEVQLAASYKLTLAGLPTDSRAMICLTDN